MKKLYVVVPAFLFVFASVRAQNDSASLPADTIPYKQPETKEIKERPKEVYTLKPGIDIPLTAIGTGWSLYAFTQIYSKDPSSQESVLALKETDVNGFDRWGIRPYSKKLDDISYLPFYGSMPLPILFLFDKNMRKDIAKLSFLYLEAMSVTGLLYTGSTYLTNRYRPYVYSEETPLDYRSE